MNQLKNKRKNTNGITLIALIITIIVLLILAGVVISMTIGSNGIINKSKASVAKYENAQEKEEYEIAKVAEDIDEYVSGNRDYETEISKLKTEIEDLKTHKVLFNGAIAENETKTLSDDINKYKKICIRLSSNNGAVLQQSDLFYDYEFLNNDGTINTNNRYDVGANTDNTAYYGLKKFKFLSNNSIKCIESYSSGYSNWIVTIVGFNCY